MRVFACVRLILVLVWGTYYVPDTYVPGISRQKYIRKYVVVRMIPTFRPWTHTSDDSYIYHLSLVVATATVSSRMKYGNRGIFYYMNFSVVDQLLPKKKRA